MLQLADHDYRIIRTASGKQGRVLLRGRAATLSYFGLCELPGLELSYVRQGGLQIGQWRTSPRKVNWQTFRIAIPEYYPSCSRFKGWSIALSANHRVSDFATLAQLIERSGVPWVGFQKKTGGAYLSREALLSRTARAV